MAVYPQLIADLRRHADDRFQRNEKEYRKLLAYIRMCPELPDPGGTVERLFVLMEKTGKTIADVEADIAQAV